MFLVLRYAAAWSATLTTSHFSADLLRNYLLCDASAQNKKTLLQYRQQRGGLAVTSSRRGIAIPAELPQELFKSCGFADAPLWVEEQIAHELDHSTRVSCRSLILGAIAASLEHLASHSSSPAGNEEVEVHVLEPATAPRHDLEAFDHRGTGTRCTARAGQPG